MHTREAHLPSVSDFPLARQIQAWRVGIQSEIHFWDKWMETRGLQWPNDFADRLKENRPFDLSDLRPGTNVAGMRVLDVGAGPMTSVGTIAQGVRIDLVACDPLAPFYSAQAAKYGISRPVETEQAFAEDLTAFYERDTFDLVHCQNALDHSFDPIRGVEQMLEITKPNGRVILKHAANEAENESYQGFHQWNFDEDNGRFIVWNKEKRIDATTLFEDRAHVVITKRDNWVRVTFDKSGNVRPIDRLAAANKRITDLLSAFIALSY